MPIGVAPEDTMMGAEVAVDPNVELILAIGLHVSPDVVIRRSRQVGIRIVYEDLLGHRIEAHKRDRVVRKLLPRRSGGVIDGCSKDTVFLGNSWNRAEARDPRQQARTLPGDEEEGFVFLDGAAERQPVLIAPVLRLRARLGKK